MTALIWIFGGAALIYLLRGYGLVIFMVCLFVMAGCTTMSPEEQEYKNGQVREQYWACRDWYEHHGAQWTRIVHIVSRAKREPHLLVMKQEMKVHGCRRYLKSLGY